MTLTVSRPTEGTSNRISCPGLLTLITTAFSLASSPPLRMVASVPSIASTASTVFFLTTTHWPMSRRPSPLATCQPKSMSAFSDFPGFLLVRHPGGASSSGRYSVEGTISMPSLASSAATALRMSSSWKMASLDMTVRPFTSGLMLSNMRRFAIDPAIRVLLTPLFLNALIM